MTSTIKDLAFDGLLVAIDEEIPEARFTELLSYYEMQTPNNITEKFRILQHIKNQGSLDLEGLATNLRAIGCENLCRQATEILDF